MKYVWNFIDETIGRVVKQLAKRGVKYSALYTATSSKAVSVHHAISDIARRDSTMYVHMRLLHTVGTISFRFDYYEQGRLLCTVIYVMYIVL